MNKFSDFKKDVNQFATTITQAIVLEVIDNPLNFKDDFKLELDYFSSKPPKNKTPYFKTGTPTLLKKQIKMAPRNAIIAVLQNETSQVPKVFYPIFSGHLSLPVKAGENVWIISPKLQNTTSTTQKDDENSGISASIGEAFCDGYWISRVVSPIYADDLNFTHADRNRSIEYVQQQRPLPIPNPAQFANLRPPHFNNGPYPNSVLPIPNEGDPTTYTLPKENDYERILTDAKSSLHTSRQAVPDYFKNPGDILLQGSNNALICIGEDKHAYDNKLDVPLSRKSDVLTPGVVGRGTIDIVAGRCSLPITPDLLDPSKITAVPNERIPEFEKEKRTWAHKAPGISVDNSGEQKIDFLSDLSRVYVSSKTDGDANFGYGVNSKGISSNYPLGVVPGYLQPVQQSPFVALRSTELRMISRKLPTGQAGSVRIIKEGSPGVDQSIIAMQPGGEIYIDSPTISLAHSQIPGANGAGNKVFIGGTDATESMVLGDNLLNLLSSLVNAIINNAPNFVATGTGPGILNPTIVSTATQIKASLDAKSILSKVGKLK